MCLKALKISLGVSNIPSVPCHGDPNPGNFLITDKNVYLMDWEYSGNNDPAWDLALLSATGEFNDRQDRLMVEAYDGDKLLFERIIIYKALVQLWRFFWARFQVDNIDDFTEKRRFLEMSKVRYNDCKKILFSSEFKNAMNRLSKHFLISY
jgi:thiamine kinase-like enzyme